MLAITHSFASFQTSAHASGRPCSKELMTNELNDDTGGRPPSRCPAGIRDRPVTPCARSPGTTAAHGCRLIACVCRPARRPTGRTVQDGAQASIAALKRAAHARSQAGACYSLCYKDACYKDAFLSAFPKPVLRCVPPRTAAHARTTSAST
jgi:hypothetical protein